MITNASIFRLWNILTHLLAMNVGASLFHERRQRSLVLIHNSTEVPFITGDQPVINLKSTWPHPPQCLAIYYPISPKLALVLGDVGEDMPFPAEGVTATQALKLNRLLFAASHKQVFAQSASSLEALAA